MGSTGFGAGSVVPREDHQGRGEAHGKGFDHTDEYFEKALRIEDWCRPDEDTTKSQLLEEQQPKLTISTNTSSSSVS